MSDTFIIYDPEDGWEEVESREEADLILDNIISHYRRRAASRGWHKEAGSIGVYRLVPVVTVRLEQTATGKDLRRVDVREEEP